ncbi:hypothetical protein UC34_25335 [Pandoraea vervacti]|uniref:Tyr recombinase domain-containing protein n=2 Tax=Pandoraea vervacti TaxID=656178 RepID=A0ABN4U6L2_9BURK|nr:hypothetical protein UC34_25335 [Pandoraea vervacti]
MGYEEGLPVEMPMQRVAVAFLFAIETAMRSSEILALTASSVNYKGKFARLPMTKNGTARNVPLSSRAIELLKMLPAVDKGEALFALSTSSRDALTCPKNFVPIKSRDNGSSAHITRWHVAGLASVFRMALGAGEISG